MDKLSDKINMTAEHPWSDGKKNSPPGSWIELWRAGVVIFGDKWTIKHGEKPSGEWNQVFLNLEPERIRRGIANMRKDAEAKIKAGDEAWPPNAFEFACLAKRNSSLYFPSNMPPGEDVKRLTQKTEFDELSPAECAKAAKRMLRGG